MTIPTRLLWSRGYQREFNTFVSRIAPGIATNSQLRLIVEPFPYSMHFPYCIDWQRVHLLLEIDCNKQDMRGRKFEEDKPHSRGGCCYRRRRHGVFFGVDEQFTKGKCGRRIAVSMRPCPRFRFRIKHSFEVYIYY